MKTMKPKVFICVPTFREPEKVQRFLQSLRHVRYRPLDLTIVNANTGDESSCLIEQEAKMVDFRIREEHGHADDFWSGTVNRGLRTIMEQAKGYDWVLLANVDITFSSDVVDGLLREAHKLGPCHVGALAIANEKVVSSGVKVRSWTLALNRHPLAGLPTEQVPEGFCTAVDLLPARCILVPCKAIEEGGLMAERLLPHYGADNEFSRRLSLLGYHPYLSGTVRIESDIHNCGKSVFRTERTFKERLSELMSIKNPSNLRYRSNFVRLTYPTYAVPSAITLYLVRTFFEVCFGGNLLKRFVPGIEHGFSE